jgi:DNA-binding transcriptional ArsR family regulator
MVRWELNDMTIDQPEVSNEAILSEEVPVVMPRLPAMLIVDNAQQFKALGDPTRTRILDIMQQKPATAKQIAHLLKMAPGTIGHHLQVLEEAGLAQIVARRLVHGIVAKYYTRTALIYSYDFPPEVRGQDDFTFEMLTHARDQLAEAIASGFIDPADPDPLCTSSFPRMRLSPERVSYYGERIRALVEEYINEDPAPDGQVYGFCTAFFKVPQYMPEQVMPVVDVEENNSSVHE